MGRLASQLRQSVRQSTWLRWLGIAGLAAIFGAGGSWTTTSSQARAAVPASRFEAESVAVRRELARRDTLLVNGFARFDSILGRVDLSVRATGDRVTEMYCAGKPPGCR